MNDNEQNYTSTSEKQLVDMVHMTHLLKHIIIS